MDTPWKPPIGQLIVRIALSPEANVTEFCYRPGHPERHLSPVARICNWRGEPTAGDYADGASGHWYLTGSGTAILRRAADPGDIEALFRLWGSRITIADWLEQVERTDIAAESKAMIARVYARHTAGKPTP